MNTPSHAARLSAAGALAAIAVLFAWPGTPSVAAPLRAARQANAPSLASAPLARPRFSLLAPQLEAQLEERLRFGKPAPRHTMSPDYPTVHAVFGSDYGGNVVQAYRLNGLPLATLVDPTSNSCSFPPFVAPAGLWVDHLRRLWVANFGSSDIRRFHVGSSVSNMTLLDKDPGTSSLYLPVSVSFDSYASHNVYAGNYLTTTSGPGNIEVWKPASQTCGHMASYSLNDPTFSQVYFVANDHVGNLYVDYIDTGGVARVCFITAANAAAPNAGICSATVGDFVSTVALGIPGGIQAFVTPTHTLGVVDQIGSAPSHLGINLYHPLPLAAAGPPMVPCTTIDPPVFVDPWQFAVGDPKGYTMWASDSTFSPGGELFLIKNHPGTCPPSGPGTAVLGIVGFTQLLGTAVSPASAP